MFTGTYPHTHGVPHNGQIVGDKNVMLPEVLSAAGFKTAGFVAAAPLDTRVNFNQGFDHYDADFRTHHQGSTNNSWQRRAAEVTNSVLTWLDAKSDDRSKESAPTDRLFLFVHYFDVHWPYDAPPPYSRMYRKDSLDVDGSKETMKHARSELRLGFRVRRSGTGKAASVGGWPCRAEAPVDPIHRSRWEEGVRLANVLDAEYCAEITYCDHHVGRLLDGLKARGLFEDSLIILTSDHGETMHEHDNVFNHGVSVYDTEIHTPLLIRFPGGVSAGERVSHLVSGVDLVPTILELLNLPLMDNLEGQSFARIVDGPLPTRAPVFAEATQPRKIEKFYEDPVWTNRGKFQCVRTEQYKYMFRIPDQVFRFFDLSVDPLEQTNLLLPQHKHDAAIVAELRVLLTAWRDNAHPISSRPSESKDHLKALRALGYVGDDSEDTEGIESPDADAP